MQQTSQTPSIGSPKEAPKKGPSSSSGNGNNSANNNNASSDDTLYHIEKVALELEKSFAYTLKTITKEYLAPLRSFLKAQLEAGTITATKEERLQAMLNTIFEGTEALFTASCTGLTQLNQSLLSRKRFWLASAYESYPKYFEAYASFLAGQEHAFSYLHMLQSVRSTSSSSSSTTGEYLLRTEIIRIHKDLQERGWDRAWPGDLLWFCSARVTHLLRLAGQQRNLHGALTESQRAWIGAYYFSKNKANTVSAGKISHEIDRLQSSTMKGLVWTPETERAYKRLEELSAAAGRLEASYQTLDVSRGLEDPMNFMPCNPGRIYLGKLPCVLLDNTAKYGLSQEVPVWILRFTDGFGAAIEYDHPPQSLVDKDEVLQQDNNNNNSNNDDDNHAGKRYMLTCWYCDGAATLTQVADPRGTRVVYKAVSGPVLPTISYSFQEHIELPPGWKCVEKVRQKCYVYEPLNIVLKSPPSYNVVAAANESERFFAVTNDDCVRAWADFADDVCRRRKQQQQKDTETEKGLQFQDSQHQRSLSTELSNSSSSMSMSSSSSSQLSLSSSSSNLSSSSNGSSSQSGPDGKETISPLSVGKLGPYKIIGSDIEEIVRYEEKVYRGTYTPAFMRLAMNYIVLRGLGEEGIFRIAWEQKAMTDMHARLDTGRYVSVEGKSPHLATNGLKLLIREASTSLMPSSLFGKFVAVLDLPEDKRSEGFITLLKSSEISETRYKAIRDMFHFLHIVACNSEQNHMLTSNIAILFAVNILWESEKMRSDFNLITRSNDVIKAILEDFNTIFGYPILNSATPRPLTVTPFVGLSNKHVNAKSFRTLIPIIPIHKTNETKKLLLSIDRDGIVSSWSATDDSPRLGSFAIAYKDFLCAAAIGRFLWVSLSNRGGIAVYDIFSALQNQDTKTPCTPVMVIDIPNVMGILGNLGYESVWCGAENSIHIFSGETLEKYGVIEESGIVTAITAVDGTVWCGVYKKDADQQEIHVWDSATSKLIAAFPAHTTHITSLCAVENGTVWSGAANGVISVWSASTYKRIKKIVHHGSSVLSMCSFGGQVWTVSRDSNVLLWSTDTNKYVGELKGYHSEPAHSIVVAQLSSNSWLVWTASSDKSICVWKSSRLPSYFNKHLEC